MYNLNGNILRLAVPSIVSNITVPLLGFVDLAIVGHIGNAQYISSVAIGTMIFNSLYWLMLFLRMGTSGMTAQAFGAGDRREVVETLLRTLSVSLMLGILLLFLSPLLRPLLIWVMNTPMNVVPLVKIYFNIVIFGAPAMLILYGLTGWFVGMQDTHTPMWVAIIQNLVNIVVSLILVIIMGWKIEGVATGTLVAQWSGAFIALAALGRKLQQPMLNTSLKLLIRNYLSIKKNIFNRHALHRFFSINRDIFLRTLCMVAVNASFTSFGGRQGSFILSANTILLMFFTFFSYIMDGFAFAGEAICGKFYGAKDTQNIYKATRHLLGFGAIMVAIFTSVYILFGTQILNLMTNDFQVISTSTRYLFWAYLIPIAGVAAFIYDGVFIGTTQTHAMLLTTFWASIIFFTVNVLFSQRLLITLTDRNQNIDVNHILWFSYILFLVLRGLIQAVYYRRIFILTCN